MSVKEEFFSPNANSGPVEKVWGIGDEEEREAIIVCLFHFLEVKNIVVSIN